MNSRVIKTISGLRSLLPSLAQAKAGVVVVLIVDEVGGVVEVAVVEAEVMEVAVMRRTLLESERGRTRIKRVGETTIGRGGMIRRWRGRELGLLDALSKQWKMVFALLHIFDNVGGKYSGETTIRRDFCQVNILL